MSKNIMKKILIISAVIFLAGCATSGPPQLSFPKGAPLNLVVPKTTPDIRITVSDEVGGGSATIPEVFISNAIEINNSTNTTRFKKEISRRQAKEPLAKLFDSELRKRIIAKGGKISSKHPKAGTPTITFSNLSVFYFSPTAFNHYLPNASVNFSSSTDPGPTGKKKNLRTVKVKLPASNKYMFASSNAIFANPSAAYAGLRLATIELAERVATEITDADTYEQK